jgi:cleavage and polyadenylation specificity factor subunit 3
MFLEAQFGSDALNPIEKPKLPSHLLPPTDFEETRNDVKDDEEELREAEKVELERLHKAGIPVPGVEIKVDKMIAKVWLENLDVECANRVFGDRVRAVVERAVEIVAPLWG